MISSPITDAQLLDEIRAERAEQAELLGGLPAASWDAQTLCAGWRVRELVAHQTMPFRYSTTRFLTELVRSGGNFHRMSDRCARRDAGRPPAELVAALSENVANPWQPPGGGLEGALIHDVIHGLDLVVPLGIERQVPPDRLRIVLDGTTKPAALRHFGADLDGIELRADDMDWSFGAGSRISGAAQDLALAVCGRQLPAGRLAGNQAARFSS
jgi:uncharacterized protein (TIGR03083 family)